MIPTNIKRAKKRAFGRTYVLFPGYSFCMFIVRAHIFIFISAGALGGVGFFFFSGGTAEHFFSGGAAEHFFSGGALNTVSFAAGEALSTSHLFGGRGLELRSSSPCRRGW